MLTAGWQIAIAALGALAVVYAWVLVLQIRAIRALVRQATVTTSAAHLGALDRATMVVFLSDSCGLCEDLARGLTSAVEALAPTHDLLTTIRGDAQGFVARTQLGVAVARADAEGLFAEYGVDGTPYAVALSADGTIDAEGPVFSPDDLVELARAVAAGQEPAVSSLTGDGPSSPTVRREDLAALGRALQEALSDAGHHVGDVRIEVLGTGDGIDVTASGASGGDPDLMIGLEEQRFWGFWRGEVSEPALILRRALRIVGSTEALVDLLAVRASIAARLDIDHHGDHPARADRESPGRRRFVVVAPARVCDTPDDRAQLCAALVLAASPRRRSDHIAAMESDLRGGIVTTSDFSGVADRIAASAAAPVAATPFFDPPPTHKEEQHGAVHR